MYGEKVVYQLKPEASMEVAMKQMLGVSLSLSHTHTFLLYLTLSLSIYISFLFFSLVCIPLTLSISLSLSFQKTTNEEFEKSDVVIMVHTNDHTYKGKEGGREEG